MRAAELQALMEQERAALRETEQQVAATAPDSPAWRDAVSDPEAFETLRLEHEKHRNRRTRLRGRLAQLSEQLDSARASEAAAGAPEALKELAEAVTNAHEARAALTTALRALDEVYKRVVHQRRIAAAARHRLPGAPESLCDEIVQLRPLEVVDRRSHVLAVARTPHRIAEELGAG